MRGRVARAVRRVLLGGAPAAGLHGFTCGPVHPIEHLSVVATDRAPESPAELKEAPAAVCGRICQTSQCRYLPRCDDAGLVSDDAGAEAGTTSRPEVADDGTAQCSRGVRHAVVCVRYTMPAAGRLGMDAVAPGTLPELEAASVHAFSELARQLHALGAPRRLVRWAERSAREEVTHARALLRVEGRARESSSLLRGRRRGARRASLVELAMHNAREGCVRELAATLDVARRARRALGGTGAHALGRIALDEASHAELALAIDRWARARLDRSARARVDATRAQALAELEPGARREVEALLAAERT